MRLQFSPVRGPVGFCVALCLLLSIPDRSSNLAAQTATTQSGQPTPTSASSAAAATNAKDKRSAGADNQSGDAKVGSGLPTLAFSTSPATPPPAPSGRPSIGLALGGGGAPAMSEIGVLQWFEEHHIPVDMIAGTSMGCMVSALYSSGKTIEELKTVMDGDVFNTVFRFQASYQSRSFRRREDSRDLPNALTIGLKHGFSFRNSLLTDQGLNGFLDREFIRYDDKTDFNAMPIPLRCLATDITQAKTVTFSRGSLPDAVRASVSLPGIYMWCLNRLLTSRPDLLMGGLWLRLA